MANKFKAEKHIRQRYSERTKLWTFQVNIQYKNEYENWETYNESFSEKDYGSAKLAFTAAVDHRNEMLKQIATVGIKKVKPILLDQVYDDSVILFPRRKETIRKRKQVYDKYIKPTLGHTDIAKITSYQVQLNLNALIEDCTDTTIDRVYTCWQYLFRTARMKKYVNINLMEEVIKPKSLALKVKKKNNKTDFDTLIKIMDKMRECTRNSDKDKFETEIMIYALFMLYYTGMRPCECYALTRQDISIKERTISVNKEIGSSATEYNVLRATKTELSTRIIPIVSDLIPILKNLLAYQDSEFLFAKFDGTLFDIDKVTNKVRYASRKLGINFNMYQLRHQFSTDLITEGVDPRTVMELMGHNNTGMTIDYARSNEELKLKALEDRLRS